ncbi:MAG TPA: class I SAM-dependent methyltransferase [Streptosporangiaceae bacterium]|nr:class I SAM-dependent methyltransferase [Streptosporangiaceae bacterium]
MTRRSEQLSDALQEYVAAHSAQPDQILQDLAADTASRFGEASGMQIGADQGAFMSMLARVIGARRAVEVGTFTGYSAICIARGLTEDGTLLCCDVSDEWTSLARDYWKRAGLADRIELRLAPAAQTLRALPAGTSFDIAFIDADKTGYVEYWDLIVPMIRQNGLIIVDNTLSHGRVVDSANTDANVEGIRRFNEHAMADDRTEIVLLPIGDGVSIARKR